jgi:hypothetical protein
MKREVSHLSKPSQSRISFSMAIIGVYWLGLLIFLVAFKLSGASVQGPAFQIPINVNLIAASLLAFGFSFVAWRKAAEAVDVKLFSVLAIAMAFLCAGEIALYATDLISGVDEAKLGLHGYLWLIGRTFLLMAFIRMGDKEVPKSGELERMLYVFAMVAMLGSVAVLMKIFAEEIPASFLYWGIDAQAGLFAVVAVIRILLNRPLDVAGRLLPAIGLTAYLLVDAFYYYYLTGDDPNFCLLEIGFFAGYLFTAIAASAVITRTAKK